MKNVKEARGRGLLKYHPGNCLQVLKKTTNVLIRSSGLDLHRAPPFSENIIKGQVSTINNTAIIERNSKTCGVIPHRFTFYAPFTA
jgi:hypothetical protein